MDFDLYSGDASSSSSSGAGLMFSSESLLINDHIGEADFDDPFNFMEQISSPLLSLIDDDEGNNNTGGAFEFPVELLFMTESSSAESFHFHCSPSSSMINFIDIDENNNSDNNIPRSPCRSISEKMTRALSLLEEDASFGSGSLLAQVWAPMRRGNDFVLSSWEEPYLVDQNHEMLAGYRQVSRLFSFSAGCSRPGLPGRVFSTKLPEWTSNVVYYTKEEYLRVEHAVDHQVRGCMALPVFEDEDDEDGGGHCAAVLELVAVEEKLDFQVEMEKICNALQAVNLKSVSVSAPPPFHPQRLSKNQRAALAEIRDVLRVVCHAHDLPLALTWLPCSSSTRLNVLCVEETGCYVKDGEMEGFLHACQERYLEEGQGIAGKALPSNHPLFVPDVKSCDISDYPPVHHARKFGLDAVVAFRLRSAYTGDDDYILELFLPTTMTTQQQQQQHLSSFLHALASTLHTTTCNKSLNSFTFSHQSFNSFPLLFPSISPNTNHSSNQHTLLSAAPPQPDQQVSWSSKQKPDKKPKTNNNSCNNATTMEKNISLNVLQQYFSGSLKDAAKSLGVCPTTLKRICRQHGILRWPSRKINKVNRSLKKIQNVLKSVEGLEGGLKFDPTTGGLVVATTTTATRQLGGYYSSTGEHLVHHQFINPNAIHSISFGNGHANPSLSHYLLGSDGIKMEPTSSGTTDSSNIKGSDTPIQGSWFNASGGLQKSIVGEKKRGIKKCSSDQFVGGSKLTVKASYREDTIRFKMEASGGCEKLYEEIGKKLKLQIGTFNVKYLDDEGEWVMLVNDSDMEECLEILDGVGSTSVRLLVRDIGCSVGSSGGSNGCFLAAAGEGGW